MRELGAKEVERIMERFQAQRPGFPQPSTPVAGYQDFNRFILVDDRDGVKIITIRRPQAMNALNDELTDEILGVLKKFAGDPKVKGFIITGYGTAAFSAGADIGKFPSMLGDPAASAQYARDCARVQTFIDQMVKPVVAALNGLAMGGGLEVAIRCHSMVAMKTAILQFPEITLGILPGIGGCVVPYRKWPRGAALFHEMICFAKPLSAKQAAEIGMVAQLADNHQDLIRAAIDEVTDLQGKVTGIPHGKVDIPELVIPDQPMAGKQLLSKEAVAITARTIQDGVATEELGQALEIGYKGFGEIACSDAAKEGISAFLERRKPEFKK
jgi:enoyl-CoA hydratase/3-hydroxyacyl-CoA dehydrogenase